MRPVGTSITFTLAALPDDHPAWTDGGIRYSGVSRQWWDVVVRDPDGNPIGACTAHVTNTRTTGDRVEEALWEATRLSRPSELVMQALMNGGRQTASEDAR